MTRVTIDVKHDLHSSESGRKTYRMITRIEEVPIKSFLQVTVSNLTYHHVQNILDNTDHRDDKKIISDFTRVFSIN